MLKCIPTIRSKWLIHQHLFRSNEDNFAAELPAVNINDSTLFAEWYPENLAIPALLQRSKRFLRTLSRDPMAKSRLAGAGATCRKTTRSWTAVYSLLSTFNRPGHEDLAPSYCEPRLTFTLARPTIVD
jgi:hypothetical protein